MVKLLECLNVFQLWHLITTNCSHLYQNMAASIMLVKTFTMLLHLWVDWMHILNHDQSQSLEEVYMIPLPEIVTKTTPLLHPTPHHHHHHAAPTECRIQLTSQDGRKNLQSNRSNTNCKQLAWHRPGRLCFYVWKTSWKQLRSDQLPSSLTYVSATTEGPEHVRLSQKNL